MFIGNVEVLKGVLVYQLESHFSLCFPLQAHLHHYCRVEGMEEGVFEESIASLNSLVAEYQGLQATMGRPQTDAPRLKLC